MAAGDETRGDVMEPALDPSPVLAADGIEDEERHRIRGAGGSVGLQVLPWCVEAAGCEPTAADEAF
jgi:hypothetical protein